MGHQTSPGCVFDPNKLANLRPSPAVAIVDVNSMLIRTLILACVLAVGVPIEADADERSDAQAQVDFGIAVAQRGLWREAIYRWERASEIDPSYAAAWNNLGIAYERQGEFDKARDAYEMALDLEPDNLNIQQNYDLFREINDRLESNR